MRTGESETQELRGFELAFGCFAFELGVLLQGFRADVGGKELRMASLQLEVGGARVAIELFAAFDDGLVERDQCRFRFVRIE